jgi:hypothetical protein
MGQSSDFESWNASGRSWPLFVFSANLGWCDAPQVPAVTHENEPFAMLA